jgi:hypothetical protein
MQKLGKVLLFEFVGRVNAWATMPVDYFKLRHAVT